jgi:FtsP/CotA-like multicopper oxidase with cupredoxin domain
VYRTTRAHIAATAVAASTLVHSAPPSTDAGTARPGGQPEARRERVVVHDNRRPAGTLADGVLTIRLEARMGQWFPDGDGRPGLTVKAFAEEGGPLQVPGPLVRVPEGTEVHAVVHNRTGSAPLALHGMYARPTRMAGEPVVIPPGETREVRFRLQTAGTYFYWAAGAPGTPIAQRLAADTQLSGVIVVDPAGETPPDDRVLLIGNWNNGVPAGQPGQRFRFVINGRSWPGTERLSFRVGETARMRLVNAGGGVHPMHLHGFYFNVDRRGDEREDVALPRGASPRLVVTERLEPGRTFALTWTPTRPGNVHTFRPSMRMRVLRDGAPLRWRALAKDGMDLPADQAQEGPSEVQMGNGETYDFEFVPGGQGEVRLDVTNGAGTVLATLPFRVTNAGP